MVRVSRRASARPALARLGGLVLLTLAVVLVACGDDATEATPTPAPPTPTDPEATPLPPDWPSDLLTLAEADFGALPVLDELQRLSNGGSVPQERVALYDLIGEDDVLEAMVFVESGGTLGDLGLAIYELLDGGPRLVTYIAAAGRIEFNRDLELFFSFEGIYEAGDAECCPSKLREIAYGWDGERFEVVSDQTVDNPDR